MSAPVLLLRLMRGLRLPKSHPEACTLSSTERLVLLSIVDHDGLVMFTPSVPRIVEQTGLCRRAVIEAIKRIEAAGWILAMRSNGRRNLYTVASTRIEAMAQAHEEHVRSLRCTGLTDCQCHQCTTCTGSAECQCTTCTPTSASGARVPVHLVHPTSARRAPQGSVQSSVQGSVVVARARGTTTTTCPPERGRTEDGTFGRWLEVQGLPPLTGDKGAMVGEFVAYHLKKGTELNAAGWRRQWDGYRRMRQRDGDWADGPDRQAVEDARWTARNEAVREQARAKEAAELAEQAAFDALPPEKKIQRWLVDLDACRRRMDDVPPFLRSAAQRSVDHYEELIRGVGGEVPPYVPRPQQAVGT